MCDRAILRVMEYIDEELPETNARYYDRDFEYRSYARWAANEIIERLIEESSRLPAHITGRMPRDALDIINEFIQDLKYCFNASDNTRSQELFYVAVDTAKRIKSMFV